MVLKRCLNALFSVLYGEMLFGTIGYKELSQEALQHTETEICGICFQEDNTDKDAEVNWVSCSSCGCILNVQIISFKIRRCSLVIIDIMEIASTTKPEYIISGFELERTWQHCLTHFHGSLWRVICKNCLTSLQH